MLHADRCSIVGYCALARHTLTGLVSTLSNIISQQILIRLIVQYFNIREHCRTPTSLRSFKNIRS